MLELKSLENQEEIHRNIQQEQTPNKQTNEKPKQNKKKSKHKLMKQEQKYVFQRAGSLRNKHPTKQNKEITN